MEKLIDSTWESGFGLEYEDKWIPIETITSRIIFKKIILKRNKIQDYIPNPAHKVVHTILKNLTPKEQNYWWKMNHKLVWIKQTGSKFKRHKNRNLIIPNCSLCKYEKETRDN